MTVAALGLAVGLVLLAGAPPPLPPPPAADGPARAAAATARADLLHGAPEFVLRRALIPSDQHAHGEVRLTRRGGARCVQTVLCSPALVRGVQAMRRKEEEAFPPGARDREASVAFREDLARATALALDEFDRRSDGADARRKLLIELVQSDSVAFYAFHGIDVETVDGRLEVTAARLFLVRDAEPSWVRSEMRLQAGSAFHLAGDELEALFASP